MRFPPGSRRRAEPQEDDRAPTGGSGRALLPFVHRRGSAIPDRIPPTPFRCDVTHLDGSIRIRPVGELDMSTVPVLEESLKDALAAGHQLLVVDLRELEFMDSTGLTLLTRWSLGAERDESLKLVAGSDRIQRLFELTRLITHFQFVDG